MNLGVFGVELFFVLSGFLIGGIIIKTFETEEKFAFSDVWHFWVRRWFRTLPNYWLVLTVCFIIYHVLLKWDTFKFHYLGGYIFLQNLHFPDTLYAFPEGWSLAVEEWFYLTLPVVIYLCASICKVRDKGAFLFRVFLGYLLVFVLIRFFNAFNPLNGRDPDVGIRKVVLFRLDAVMYGVLFAHLNYYRPHIFERIKKSLLLMSMLLFGATFYLCIHYQLVFVLLDEPMARFARNAFLYLFMPLALSMCLPYANSVKTIKNTFLSKTVQHISKISYSMYLVHFSLVYKPLLMQFRVNNFSTALLYYLFYWIVVLVLSSLIYKYFEYPVMGLRERFKPKRALNNP